MNKYACPCLQRRDKFSKDLDAVLIRPVVHDRPEVVNICTYRLFGKEVAAQVSDVYVKRQWPVNRTDWAMNSIRSRRDVGNLACPSATTPGKS